MPPQDSEGGASKPSHSTSKKPSTNQSASPPSKKTAPGAVRNGALSRDGFKKRTADMPRDRPPHRRRQDDERARKRSRSPSRSRSRSRSPPRKKPGAGAAISAAAREAARKRTEEREREQAERARIEVAARGVQDVVREHYNAVPERGREWRKTDSKIKGLRSLNNWVKSCLIQKFAPGEGAPEGGRRPGSLLVLDVGCGKGGDLQKWASAPQHVALYVGCDPADVSVRQARERYQQMQKRQPRNRPSRLFEGHFFTKDCFGEFLGDIPIISQVGIDPSVGPGAGSSRWGGGGWDIVSMMFCMHYAFESEQKARGMLRNVSGALKKGGRFLGVIPNSDILSAKVEEHHLKAAKSGEGNGYESEDDWDPEKSLDTEAKQEDSAEKKEEGEVEDDGLEWGNDIYKVKFPSKTPHDGVFRPPFGWKYFYFLEEAVGEVPEYVVPWEAFRALAEEYNLELTYRKPFNEIWEEENNHPELGPLSERMGVRERNTGRLLVSQEEMDAASFYHAFCFYKV